MRKEPRRCIVLELPDGTRAIVRTSGRQPLTERDRAALREMAQAMKESHEPPHPKV